MKALKLVLLFNLAVGLAWGGPLTEESIRELLKARSEAFEQADVETIVGLYTTNAVISVSFFGIPGSKEETDPREFAEAFSTDMKLVAYSTDPSEIDWVDGGAMVAAETHLSHVPGKNRNRAISWQIRETFNFALIDDRLKITKEQIAIVNQTLEPDELSERIMKLVRQEGGIDKETALKLLEESGCKYEEGDSKRKKSSISAGYGMLCGDEIGALASYVPGVQSLQLGMSIISDKGLAVIGQIQTLEALHLMGMGITDTGIGYLANLDRLEFLSMMGVGITDASFEHFAGFPALKKLHLTAALSVTDAGLFHLSKNKTLESLTLTINMTDAGLAHLANVPNLGSLRIQGAPITDAGLVHVEQMEKLTSITLNSTEVTHIGARRLREKRPQLKISPLSLVEPCTQARSRIEYAKKKWAENEKQKEGATPTREELDLLLKRYGGFDALTCVDGGILSINPIGIGAECSIHGKTKARKPTPPMKGLSKEDFDIAGAKVGRWTMDLEAAKKLAAVKQLPILINFTGSDWCGWCKLMEKNVFTQPEWKAYATNHIVMVLIDFPRNKKLVPEQFKERNNQLKNQYEITGYPTFVLLRPDGKMEVARLKAGRSKTPDIFIAEIKAALNKRQPTAEEISATAIHSTFDDSDEGWGLAGGEQQQPKHRSGTIGATLYDPDGQTTYYVAPAKFHGDWSSFGILEFELNSSRGDYYRNNYEIGGDVQIANGNLTATHNLPYHPSNDWKTFSIPLNGRYWIFGGGATELKQVLQNVTDFKIRAEYGFGRDKSSLDNVFLFKRETGANPGQEIRPASSSDPCTHHLQLIEQAKFGWANKNIKDEGTLPTPEDLESFLEHVGGYKAMYCEEDGTISINPAGTGAECSIHGKTKPLKPSPPLKGLLKEDFDIDGAKVGRWTMDLDAAKKLAAEKRLPVLINFTGSDWCGWCKLMEKNVFTNPKWSAYAKNSIVMVLIDFPRDKTAVPEKYKERNNALKGQYGISDYPTFVLLKPDGTTELWRLKAGREKTPERFIKEVNAMLNTEEG